MAVKVVRIFNTYGPRMRPDDGRVVSNFIVQALSDQPLTLYGDGRQTRSFCYVDDMVSGLLAMMRTDSDTTGPINLGNPQETSVKELADSVMSLVGKSAPIVHEPLPVDDPQQRKPDITLARETLGWEPTTMLEDGLRRTVRWFAADQD